MTNSGISTPGEGTGPGGLCQAPQQPSRWTQGVTVPVQCFTVRLEVHQQSGGAVHCYSVEVADPHTKELLAHIVEPSRRTLTQQQMVSAVTTDIRAILLDLTDPDPF